MLQRRIVIQALGNQIDTGDQACTKYTFTYFHTITWMWISVIVTVYRTDIQQRCQGSSHCIMMTLTKLGVGYKI
jgi:hypothetical protein